jgi:hypothetical protein
MGFQLMTALEQRRFLSVSAHLRVLNNETTIEAGQSVHVSAMPNRKGAGTNFGGDPTAAQIEWNFHDPQGSYNHLPGFNAAHVYERPGKYKITLRVTNKGETDTASRIIKVVAPQRKRVYVNPWGNDNNNGKTPGKAVATIDRAMQLVGNNTELLFRNEVQRRHAHLAAVQQCRCRRLWQGQDAQARSQAQWQSVQADVRFVEQLTPGKHRKPASGIERRATVW